MTETTPTFDEIRDVLNECAAAEDRYAYSNFDNTAFVMRWLASNVAGLVADRDRLEYVFEEIAAYRKDKETQEECYRLDWETGWCMGFRAAIDADRLSAARGGDR